MRRDEDAVFLKFRWFDNGHRGQILPYGESARAGLELEFLWSGTPCVTGNGGHGYSLWSGTSAVIRGCAFLEEFAWIGPLSALWARAGPIQNKKFYIVHIKSHQISTTIFEAKHVMVDSSKLIWEIIIDVLQMTKRTIFSQEPLIYSSNNCMICNNSCRKRWLYYQWSWSRIELFRTLRYLKIRKHR